MIKNEIIDIDNDTLLKWKLEQINIKNKLKEEDLINIKNIKYILCMFIVINKNDKTRGYIGYTVTDYKEGEHGKIVHCSYEQIINNCPFIVGYTGFREVPFLNSVYKKIIEHFKIDLVIINSYGKLHDRLAGTATHFATLNNISVIGIGKSIPPIDNLKEVPIKIKFKKKCKEVGDYIELIGSSGISYGAAVKNCSKSINPIYVTVGNHISLETSIEIIINLSITRMPEPIKEAEKIARRM